MRGRWGVIVEDKDAYGGYGKHSRYKECYQKRGAWRMTAIGRLQSDLRPYYPRFARIILMHAQDHFSTLSLRMFLDSVKDHYVFLMVSVTSSRASS